MGRVVVSLNKNGFSVWFRDTNKTVEVSLGKDLTYFEVGYDSVTDRYINDNCFKLHAFHSIRDRVFCLLTSGWEPPNGKKKWPKMFLWIKKVISQAYGKLVYDAWRETLKLVPDNILALDKRLFAATFDYKPCKWLARPELKYSEYFLKDVMKFRSAALVLNCLDEFFHIECFKQQIGSSPTIDNFPDWGFISRNGSQSFRNESLSPEEVFQQVERNWHRCFSPSLKSYTSLSKTLTKYPGCIPRHLSLSLRNVKLERPVYRRSELILILNSCGIPTCGGDHHHNDHVLNHATHNQIKKSLHILSNHLRRPLSIRRSSDITDLGNYLTDCRERHNGNIVGLTHRSIHWHRTAYLERLESQTKYPLDTPTMIPPVELPENNKIKFLSSVDDIVKEGESMFHCIGGYSNGAVRGKYYLFHAEFKGNSASIQVDSQSGRVLQCQGPHNHHNPAVDWAKKELRRWGKKLARNG